MQWAFIMSPKVARFPEPDQKKDNRVVVYLTDSEHSEFLEQRKIDKFDSNNQFLRHIILEYLEEKKGLKTARFQHNIE